jgi:hypothetical protein
VNVFIQTQFLQLQFLEVVLLLQQQLSATTTVAV